MHRRIDAARRALDKAHARLEKTVAEIQRTCKHPQVIETPFKANRYLSDDLPRRMCLVCGHEEEAWSWPGYVYTDDDKMVRTKLNTPFVKVVDRDEFFQSRP